MAFPNIELIGALRETSRRLRNGVHYAWGHHGACNCGNLLQVVTHLTKEEILVYAQSGRGEWTELAEEYCPVSRAPFQMLLSRLEMLGLTPMDIHNLEYLEDRAVLEKLAGGFRWLSKNLREDVIEYFECFAQLLEDELIKNIQVDYSELVKDEPDPISTKHTQKHLLPV